jgi:hypothetical protein
VRPDVFGGSDGSSDGLGFMKGDTPGEGALMLISNGVSKSDRTEVDRDCQILTAPSWLPVANISRFPVAVFQAMHVR